MSEIIYDNITTLFFNYIYKFSTYIFIHGVLMVNWYIKRYEITLLFLIYLCKFFFKKKILGFGDGKGEGFIEPYAWIEHDHSFHKVGYAADTQRRPLFMHLSPCMYGCTPQKGILQPTLAERSCTTLRSRIAPSFFFLSKITGSCHLNINVIHYCFKTLKRYWVKIYI